MEASYLHYARTGLLNPLITALLSEQRPIAGYSHPYSLQAVLDHQPKGPDIRERQLLQQKLREQYERSGILEKEGEATYENIRKLDEENTFTVTTGHQLCLFTGPLFFPYKILSTIRLAEELNQKAGDSHYVPVFWMASEDHDFEEASGAKVFQQTLRWETDQQGAVGRMDPSGIEKTIGELEELLSNGERDQELLSLFRKAYLEHDTMADATRFIVHRLLGHHGLVVLDADDPELKALFQETMKAELTEHLSFKAVEATTGELQEAGYERQVTPREINLFYLESGHRERIVQEGQEYQVLNRDLRFTREELLQELTDHPERFSPNVVLRPLYQERILPNAAYIGGGGELSYWLQLTGVFRKLNTPMPVLALRNSALLLDRTMSKKMEKCGLSSEEFFRDLHEVIKTRVTEGANEELDLEEEKQAMEKVYQKVKAKAVSLDPSLEKKVKGQLQKQLNTLEELEKRLIKAEKDRQETKVKQIEGLFNKAFPDQTPQERAENFTPFYLRYGATLFRELHGNFIPMDDRLLILRDEG